MKTIAAIADEILDSCKIPPGSLRDCLRCEIAQAIASERHALNDQVQSLMANFRLAVEETLLPRGIPENCGGENCTL